MIRIPWLHLQLPKRLIIKNRRIIILYNILFFIGLVFTVFKFALYKEYALPVNILTIPTVSVYDNEVMKLYRSSNTSLPICSILPESDQSSSMGSNWENVFSGCQNLCDFDLPQNTFSFERTCKTLSDLMRTRSSQDVFFTTAIREWNIMDGGKKFINWTVYPWVTSATMELSVRYLPIDTVPWGLGLNPEAIDITGDETHMTLVMLDQQKKPYRVVQRQRMKLAVSEVEFLALDSTNGASSEQASMILLADGLELELTAYCHDQVPHWLRKWLTVDASYKNLICLMQFIVVKRGGVTTDISQSHVKQELHGFHIVAKDSTSSVYFLSMRALILGLVAALVLLEIPAKLMLLITCNCLGRLSTFYYEELYEICSVSKSCAAWAVRLVHSAASFHLLSMVSEHDWAMMPAANPKLTFRNFRLPLHASLCNNKDLQEVGVRGLGAFAFQELLTAKKEVRDELLFDMTEWASLSCALSAGASYNALSHLVDKERKQAVLERILNPPHLEKLISHLKTSEIVDSEDGLIDVTSIGESEAEGDQKRQETDVACNSEDLQTNIKVAVEEAVEASLGRIKTEIASLGSKVDRKCAEMELTMKCILDKFQTVSTLRTSEIQNTLDPCNASVHSSSVVSLPGKFAPLPPAISRETPPQLSNLLADLQNLQIAISSDPQHQLPTPDLRSCLSTLTNGQQQLLQSVSDGTLNLEHGTDHKISQFEQKIETVKENVKRLQDHVYELAVVFSGRLEENERAARMLQSQVEDLQHSILHTARC